ncbi:MAG: PfkB family carbohydrate kinase [Johnsonella sp.]|nr:PfkB family carbohydrate kinase [Johnsonella sp.]
MTIKEFAEIAGVSVSTISKIMNNKDESISAETREHVLRLAKEYHYSPGRSALYGKKTMSLGLIIRSEQDIGDTLGGVLHAASEMGYTLILKSSNHSPEIEKKNILTLLGMNVDGILWERVSPFAEENEEFLIKSSLPYIKLMEESELPIAIDFHHMGYRATKTLIDKNHTEIACFLKEGRRRESFLEGYKKCLFDHQIKFNEEFIFHSIDEELIRKLAKHSFSAILTSHYHSAADFYRIMEKLHYSIPYDLSLISLKEGSPGDSLHSPISALYIPYKEYGFQLTKYLIHLIEKNALLPVSELDISLNHDATIDIPYQSRLKKIISIGSINIDHYMNFDALPNSGMTAIAPNSYMYPGGKCINQAIGAAKLGHSVSLLGSVGNDGDADFIYSSIAEYQIDAFALNRKTGYKTGQAYIFVQRDGNSMISIVSGANNALSEQDILNNERIFANASYCLLQTEIPLPTVKRAAKIAKMHGVKTVLKPSAAKLLPSSLLKSINIIVPNLEELHAICPEASSMEEKAAYLLSLGIETVIVTLADRGFYLRQKSTELFAAAEDFKSVDSTGAGDAFISALVSYLLYGYSMIKAAKIANYAAGFSITRQGVTPSLIDKNSLESYILQRDADLILKKK